jgi:2-polyprenyl-6-methoxyphenol hydroxylase-like FAD-dependent oxidoreductase
MVRSGEVRTRCVAVRCDGTTTKERIVYDVIVVGARCAGSPTAMLLARSGHRVLLVDRATFPSDTNSTHYVQQPAVARLRRWGVLDRIVAGCPPIPTYGLDFGPLGLRGHPTPYEGEAMAYAPRRTVLDTALVEAASGSGATVETGFAVEGLLFDAGKVVGIAGRTEDGRRIREHARVVVGADGLHSVVARAVEAGVYDDRGAFQCAYYTYWHGVPTIGFDGFVGNGSNVAGIPTSDDITCIPALWPVARFKEVRADVEAHYLAALDQTPLGAPVRAGTRAERWHGMAALPNFFRTPVGPGWALVGDAGYYQDPITGHGITNAFRDAELLAAAIGQGLAGDTPMDVALAQFHRARDEAARPMFELTCTFASGPPSPEVQALLRALEGNPRATDQFFGMLAGTVHPDAFFAPDNVAAIMEAAGKRVA